MEFINYCLYLYKTISYSFTQTQSKMLHLYYTNLGNPVEKRKFIQEVIDKCKVTYPIVQSWIAKPAAKGKRNPKAIYRPILSEITGIPEKKLFKN